jgi:glycosyltransferase involved in cell wall biosynthesis
MRVHVFGGVLAYDYLLAGWLRASGVDAHYFFNYKLVEADYPWWEDRSFDRHNMPEWCHFYPFRLPYRYAGRLGTTGRRFVRDFNRDADVALVVGDGLFLAHHYTVPYVLWSCGYDIETAVPAPVSLRGAISKVMGGPEPVRLQRAINRRHVRERLQRAELIMTVMDFQIPTYLAWTGVTTPAYSVPMPYDCSRYAPVPVPALIERYASTECVFFLPTRHSYGSHSTNDKGADKVIRAFASVVRDLPRTTRLVLVEKGERIAESKAAVQQLGISEFVDWIPELQKSALKEWYSLPGVVVLDQFPNEDTLDPRLHEALRRRGGRGSIFAEAMCMGCPLISNVGSEWIEELRPPRVWNACFESEIAAAMRSAANLSPAERIAGGNANRRWAEAEIDWPKVMGQYIELLETAVRSTPVR